MTAYEELNVTMLSFSKSNTDRSYFNSIVVLGQFLGLLPLETNTVEISKFVWKSKKVAYTVLHIAGTTGMTSICIYHLFGNGFQLVDYGKYY